MERISIQELAAVLTVKNGLKKKEAERFVAAIFETVKDVLKTDRAVKIKGLGTFKIVETEPRESVNVNTGERVLIDGYAKISFTPDTAMKDLVNKPFSQFETVVLNEGVDFSEISNQDLEEVEEQLVTVEAPVEEEFVDEPVEEVLPAEEPVPELLPIVEEERPAIKEDEEINTPILDVFDDIQEQEQKTETETEEIVDENAVVSTSVVTEVQEETPEVQAEEVDEDIEQTDDEPEEDIEESSSYGKYLWIGLALVACVLSFWAGYMTGIRNAEPVVEVQDTLSVPVETAVVAVDTVKADTVKAKTAANAANGTSETKPVAQPAKEDMKPTPAVPAKPAGAQKYEEMDARVRTGAYYIVGTAQEVKVKEGETLRRIAQRHLGPDMECYIEVYNGLTASTPLTVGQIIKIPKLEHKKKKKEQTNN